jgi:hypothetical protein
MRVLCCREIMRSLRESVHHLLVDTIDAFGLTAFFDATDREITCRTTGSEIILASLWGNINRLSGRCVLAGGETGPFGATARTPDPNRLKPLQQAVVRPTRELEA